MCIYPDCKTSSIYNFEGQTKRLYCASHKLDGMVNLKNKPCIHPNCKIRPTYNLEGETKALYCNTHKLNGMVNVRNNTCVHPNCKTQSNYNIQGETKGLYCSLHKLEGMINVTCKNCIHTNCKKYPNYNLEDEIKPLYCFSHKLEGMIDIKHKKCIQLNCKVRPVYNFEGEKKAIYCFSHKKEEMINVVVRTCIYTNCKIRPSYNIEGKNDALYCEIHKLDGMINIRAKTCQTHLCYKQVNEKYDGYCLRCFVNLFPDKPVSRNYKTKEFAVVEFVKNKFENYSWIADKMVNNGCSKKRPDLLLDLGYQVIIIEIDENQHIDYDCSCENKRIMELSQDLGHRSIIFIRFNPDDYNTKEKKITSCWGLNGKGICIVKKSKKDEWEQRLHRLEQQINYWVNPENKTDKTIEIIQLFYNNN
jgi:hypothetical protein